MLRRSALPGQHHDEQAERVVNHHRGWRINQPGSSQQQGKGDHHAAVAVRSPKQHQQQEGQDTAGQQFGKRTSPVNDHEMIGIDRVKRGGEDGVAPRQPLPHQHKH